MTARAKVAAHLAMPQHRNAYCLLLNNALGAASGLVFLLLFTRVLHLAPAEVGLGYAVVALGTIVGVVAKGGLDAALLRALPNAPAAEANRIFRFALMVGCAVALVLAAGIAFAAAQGWIAQESLVGSALVATIGVLLVLTWLQDARFLAFGDARPSLKRNLVLSGARLAAPLPVVFFALPRPVAFSSAMALALSALAGVWLGQRLPPAARKPGVATTTTATSTATNTATTTATSTATSTATTTATSTATNTATTTTVTAAPSPEQRIPPTRSAFFANSLRNASSSAAEFLPGLILVPVVLAVAGAESAAYFAMAWTVASLLFLASSALSRNALAEIMRGPATMAESLRKGVQQHMLIVLPAALLMAAMAAPVLSFFGPAYAQAGAFTLLALAASIVLVAPGNLYLAVLRARDSPFALAAFPVAMIALLLTLTPPFVQMWGLPGVALAWAVANAPLGIVGTWALVRAAGAGNPGAQPAARSTP